MAKWGLLHTVVTNNDPAELGELRHLFDLIVADVPCSGEGMFRKDTDSTGEWSVANVQLCAARSRRIIHDIWDALRPGGLLVYSTCTYNLEEDEENVRYFVEELGATALPVPTDPAWQVTGALRYDHPVYHFFPHRTRGEGFFLAVLQKAAGDWDELPLPTKKSSKKGKREVAPADPTGNRLLSQLCATNPSIQPCSSASGTLGIATPEVAAFLPYLSTCRVLSAGVPLGESKGKDFVPSQALALCTALPEPVSSGRTDVGRGHSLPEEGGPSPASWGGERLPISYLQKHSFGICQAGGESGQQPLSARVAHTYRLPA